MTRQYNQLPQVAFSILLALTLKPRHGYEIIKQVEDASSGKIRLGAGTLYTSIKQLYEKQLIEEVTAQEDTRRRYYRLTDKGREVLSQELEYYKNSLELAKKRQVLLSGNSHA
jgi:DNA-binding PadR family transcriptional regulator